MKVEDNNALRFILQDEIYLLDEDKNSSGSAPTRQPEIQTLEPVFNYLGSNKKSFGKAKESGAKFPKAGEALSKQGGPAARW